ncbi:ethionine resistance protein [Coemansia sp. RSA 486]|nr:ethionine resistance protein [Coemansia sp. RSA 486]
MPRLPTSGPSLKTPGSETKPSRARRSSLFIHVSPSAIRHSVSIPADNRHNANTGLVQDTNSKRNSHPNSVHTHTPRTTSSFSSHLMLTPSPTPALQTHQPTNVAPLFLAPTLLSSSSAHNESHPSHLSPRSLNRRQSIALQSSFSSDAMTPSLVHPWPLLARPHTVYAQDLTSNATAKTTRSARASSCFSASTGQDAQRERRRSMAYERYPPLGSIFEFRTEPLSPPSRTPYATQHTNETDYFSSTHKSERQQQRRAEMAVSDPWAGQITSSTGINGHGLNSMGNPERLLLLVNQEGLADDFTMAKNGCAQSKHARRTSLASSVFSVAAAAASFSSSSSSSSSASSYAYLFDRARPSQSPEATFDPVYAVSASVCASAPASAATTTTAIVSTTLPRKRRYTAPVLFSALANSRPRTESILYMMDNTMLVSPLAGQMHPHAVGNSETTPLLRQQHPQHISAHADVLFQDNRLSTMAIASRESRYILSTSSHLLLGSVLQAVISMSQIASSGHLGRNELAGIGLAHVLVILSGYPVAFSVLSCFETCASQAFTSTNPRLVGGYFIRAIQMQWVLGLVLGALWFSAEPLLTYIMHGNNPTVVAFATSYLRWYFVPFMVFANYLCAKQVLYAQGITYPLPYLTFLGAVVTLSGQYLFVFSPYFSLGVRGIALGNGFGYLSMLVATLWLVYRHNVSRIWGGLNARAAPWGPFLRLLPHCLVLSLFSTGTSELITMAATQLGTQSLAVQAVLSTLSRMFMLTFSSIGVTALNRTGNLIGCRSARGARISSNVAFLIGLLCAVVAGSAMAMSPETWVRVFTNDEQVVRDATKIVPVAILAFACQSISFVGSQLLSAQGRQSLAVRIKFATLYVIGVPLGYYWAMVSGYGLAGLWAAVAVGQMCTTIAEIAVVLKTNWSRLIDHCTESIIIH